MTGSRADEIEAAAAGYVAREDAGPLSDDEKAARDRWLALDARHETAYLRLSAAWDAADILFQAAQTEPAQTLAARPGRRWGRAALSAGLAMAAAVAIMVQPAGVTYKAAIGDQVDVALPDGSQVELNTQTNVESRIGSSIRRIKLVRGEAFFRVKHMPEVPFVVEAGAYKVTAVGTAFSVRLEGEQLTVAVEEGTVRIEKQDGSGARLAHAGTVSQTGSAGIAIAPVGSQQIEQSLAWRDGLLAFDQTALSDITAEFNRYNRHSLRVDGAIGQRRIGGVFKATEMEAFVRLLVKTNPDIAASTQADGAIVLSEKK